MMNIKVCGITTIEAIKALNQHMPAFAGFVFFPPSPRHVSAEQAKNLTQSLNKDIATVAVMVDPTDDMLNDMTQIFVPDYIQLHGNETPKRAAEIRNRFNTKIIKALPVRVADDIAHAQAYNDIADIILFDAKAPKNAPLPGGNGLAFDWTLLQHRHFSFPWMLSGGLNDTNVIEAIEQTHAPMIDISSGVESAPGIKDPALIKTFLEKVAAL